MTRYFTADTHFGSQRALELSKRPFNDIAHMDRTMVANWNKIVGEDDEVYHLGDFGNYSISHLLNGTIHLLYGNYERNSPPDRQYNFDIIWTSDNQIIPLKDEEVAIVHEPSHRVLSKFNLFGHIHKLQMVKEFGLNVGVDCHNFTPISEETVAFYKGAIESHYDHEVFM